MFCADNKNIRFRLSFVPNGSVLEPMPERVALDVGNRLCHGIIDHHQPGAGNECAASLILQYPHYILEYLQDIPVDKVTICTHFYPDLDAVTSAYFCHFLLLKKKFPRFAAKIAAYVLDIDQGICFRHSVDAVTLYSIFMAMCELIRQDGNQRKWSKNKISRARMECGFSLLKYVISKMEQQTDLHDSEIFTKPHPFDHAHDLITRDYNSYLEDIKQCRQVWLTLPYKDRKDRGIADAAIIENPRSLLFRSRARRDKVHSSSGKGFSILIINYDNKRYVISADPQTQFYLKGLGDLLEEVEKKKRKALGMERQGQPRPGYTSSDPWYDGRDSFHNYTIIDTPRNGTLLTWDEIQKIVLQYGRLN